MGAIPSAPGVHNPCLYPGMAGPGLANASGQPLQQHNIQNSNLKYEMYLRIISSSKCALTRQERITPDQLAELDVEQDPGLRCSLN